MVENDIDVAALAERAHGHGRDVDSFAFISIGTGLGMGLVLGGKLHRGAHGAAGEIGYMPFSEGHGADVEDAQLRGSFEAASTAAAVVRAATRAGVVDASSAQQVFSAAAHGDSSAAAVVAEEALLVAKAVCAVITVVDPDLVVLGGGIGQAPGFMAAVQANLATMAPVLPTVKTSALGRRRGGRWLRGSRTRPRVGTGHRGHPRCRQLNEIHVTSKTDFQKRITSHLRLR